MVRETRKKKGGRKEKKKRNEKVQIVIEAACTMITTTPAFSLSLVCFFPVFLIIVAEKKKTDNVRNCLFIRLTHVSRSVTLLSYPHKSKLCFVLFAFFDAATRKAKRKRRSEGSKKMAWEKNKGTLKKKKISQFLIYRNCVFLFFFFFLFARSVCMKENAIARTPTWRPSSFNDVVLLKKMKLCALYYSTGSEKRRRRKRTRIRHSRVKKKKKRRWR